MRMHCVSHIGFHGGFPHWGSPEGRGFGPHQGPHCHHGPLSFGPLGAHGPHGWGHGHGHGPGHGFGRWAPYGGFGGRGRWGAWSAWGRPGFDMNAPWQGEQSGCGPWGRHDCGHHHHRHAHGHDHEEDHAHDHGHGHRHGGGGGGRGRGRRAGGGGCERRARSPSPESDCGCGCEGGGADDGASRCRVWWADEDAATAAASSSCCGRHRCHARGDGQVSRTRPRAPSCPPALGAHSTRDR